MFQVNWNLFTIVKQVSTKLQNCTFYQNEAAIYTEWRVNKYANERNLAFGSAMVVTQTESRRTLIAKLAQQQQHATNVNHRASDGFLASKPDIGITKDYLFLTEATQSTLPVSTLYLFRHRSR